MTFQNKLIIFTKEKIWNINQIFPESEINELDLRLISLRFDIYELSFIRKIYNRLEEMGVKSYKFNFITVVTGYKKDCVDALFLTLTFGNIIEIDSQQKYDLLENIETEISELYRAYESIWIAIYALKDIDCFILSREGYSSSSDTQYHLENADYSLKMIAEDVYMIFKRELQIFSALLPEVY
jgi:hypothetical protein